MCQSIKAERPEPPWSKSNYLTNTCAFLTSRVYSNPIKLPINIQPPRSLTWNYSSTFCIDVHTDLYSPRGKPTLFQSWIFCVICYSKPHVYALEEITQPLRPLYPPTHTLLQDNHLMPWSMALTHNCCSFCLKLFLLCTGQLSCHSIVTPSKTPSLTQSYLNLPLSSSTLYSVSYFLLFSHD